MIDLNHRLSQVILVAISYIFVCSSVASSQQNKQQPVYISSDRAQRDNQKNVTVYEGNVELTQGTLKILADKLTIYNYAKGISKIIAIGQPAHYQQQSSAEKDNIIAKANSITYELEKEHVLLQGDASLDQAGTTLKGEVIDYDIQAAVMRAASDMRIQMVIPPNNNK